MLLHWQWSSNLVLAWWAAQIFVITKNVEQLRIFEHENSLRSNQSRQRAMVTKFANVGELARVILCPTQGTWYNLTADSEVVRLFEIQ
jgi:hypothetical protein